MEVEEAMVEAVDLVEAPDMEEVVDTEEVIVVAVALEVD